MKGYTWEFPVEDSYPITILGIGTTGLAIVGHLYQMAVRDVRFVICHADDALLRTSPVSNKLLYDADGDRTEAEQDIKVEITQIVKSSELIIIVTDVSHSMDCLLASTVMTVCAELAKFTIVAVGLSTLADQLLRKEANDVLASLQRQASSLMVYEQTHLATQQRVYQLAEGILGLLNFCDGFIREDFATMQSLVTGPGRIAVTVGMASGDARSKRALEAVIIQLNEQPFDVRLAQRLLFMSATGEEEPGLIQEHVAIMKDTVSLLMHEPEMAKQGLTLDRRLLDTFRISSLFWMPEILAPTIP